MTKLNNTASQVEGGTPQTSYQWNDLLSSSSECLATNFTLAVMLRNTKTVAARRGGRQSNMSTYFIEDIMASNVQHAIAWGRIIGIVFRPIAASPERSLKSVACPYNCSITNSRNVTRRIKFTVSVNVRPFESMAIIDLLLMGS
jgi:hypothetical protein